MRRHRDPVVLRGLAMSLAVALLLALAGCGGDDVDPRLMGTTRRDDGTTQVTYNDWPLYYFAGDELPGDSNGQGVGDVWWMITPAGELVMG
jgi:hypothetical protein